MTDIMDLKERLDILALNVTEEAMILNRIVPENVFVNYSGHVEQISVRIVDDRDYEDDESVEEVILNFSVYLRYDTWGDDDDPEEKEGIILRLMAQSYKHLYALLNKLQEFNKKRKVDRDSIEEVRFLVLKIKY